ncbi:DUF2934 domain-containing protein [Cereibacter sphaeroides]|uniref:DUF2934 domain-containing protein n=1 Tax=Cereibacter sphaeroides TaxID=1063 RepID=UPI001F328B27|nr:DUF2934 domain-containing protein [Cereibacter sphaeroides]MCE6949551.1 DUF2934 domain-containing protein [Cereibacter sphaeroides]
MTDDRHERISQRAHALWEREGKPEGRDAEHWRMAREEIEAEDAAAGIPDAAANSRAGEDRKPRKREIAKPG